MFDSLNIHKKWFQFGDYSSVFGAILKAFTWREYLLMPRWVMMEREWEELFLCVRLYRWFCKWHVIYSTTMKSWRNDKYHIPSWAAQLSLRLEEPSTELLMHKLDYSYGWWTDIYHDVAVVLLNNVLSCLLNDVRMVLFHLFPTNNMKMQKKWCSG